MFLSSKKQKEVAKEISKSFAEQLNDANKIFIDTIEKLKNISTGVTKKVDDNNIKLRELELENIALTELKNKADRQVEQISQLMQ